MMDKFQAAKSPATATKARNAAMELYQGFLHRLQQFRVLDPACGSGNFFLLTLLGPKDLEHRVITEAESMGLARQFLKPLGLASGVDQSRLGVTMATL